MKPSSRNFIYLSILIIVTGMNCQPGEMVPIKDGDYLEYRHIIYGPLTTSSEYFVRITFTKIDNKSYKVNITPSEATGGKIGVTDDEIAELVIDKFFKTASGKYLELTPIGPLWIPSSSRREGASVEDNKIHEIKRWQDWEVCVLSRGGVGASMNWYYEKTTGFLVGCEIGHMGAGMKVVLIETNIEGLGDK